MSTTTKWGLSVGGVGVAAALFVCWQLGLFGFNNALTNEQIEANCNGQAEELLNAMIAGDYPKIFDRTVPSLLDAGGGRTRLREKLQRFFTENKAKIVSGKVTEGTKIAPRGSEWYGIVPTVTVVAVERNKTVFRARQKSFLVAFSSDGGREWTFIDGTEASDDAGKLTKYLPNFPSSLALPKKEAPELENKDAK